MLLITTVIEAEAESSKQSEEKAQFSVILTSVIYVHYFGLKSAAEQIPETKPY